MNGISVCGRISVVEIFLPGDDRILQEFKKAIEKAGFFGNNPFHGSICSGPVDGWSSGESGFYIRIKICPENEADFDSWLANFARSRELT